MNSKHVVQAPPKEVMSEVLDLLGVFDSVARSAHAHFLNETVKSFSFWREVTKQIPTIHEAVATIGKFKAQLQHDLEAMKGMRPEIRIMMATAEPPFEPQDWQELIGMIERLVLTLGKLDRSEGNGKPKLAKRLPDNQLEQTVAFLMLRVRDITGKLAHARPADSRYRRPAILASNEAKAIWMLLKHLRSDITESNIANRIVALKRLYGDELEEKFSHYAFTGGKLNFHIPID